MIAFPCCSGLGADAFPIGTRAETSAALAAILQTPKGRAVYDAARAAAQNYYKIVAVGSQTQREVVDRIAGVFTEFYAARWEGPVTPEALAKSETFRQTVALVCLLCNRKGTTEAEYIFQSVPLEKQGPMTERDWPTKPTDWSRLLLVGGIVLAAGAVLFMLFPKRRREAVPSAALVPALPR